MPIRQSTVNNISWLAGSNILVKPVWFLFLIMSARMLGAERFGLYMYSISLVLVVSAFMEFGIDINTIKLLSLRPELYPKYFFHSICAKISSAFLVFIIVLVVSFILKENASHIILIILACVYSGFNMLLLHCRAIFRAFEVMKYEAITIVFEKVMVVILCGVTLIVYNDLMLFMCSFVVAYSIISGLALMLVVKIIGKINLQLNYKYLWNEVLKPAIPFALMNIFIVLYFRSSTLMIEALTKSETMVGYYNVGYRLVESYMLFPTIIAAPLYPVFARSLNDPVLIKKVLDIGIRIMIIISSTVVVPLFLFSEEFTILLFGHNYSEASSAVGILSIAMIPISITFIVGSLVAMSGKQNQANIAILFISALNIILNYIFIPLFNVSGAAWATVITEFSLMIANVWLLRNYFSIKKLSLLSVSVIFTYGISYLLYLSNILDEYFLLRFIIITIIQIVCFIIFRIINLSQLIYLIKKRRNNEDFINR
jgi:O-antigen/teichoic acid export membrane protein